MAPACCLPGRGLSAAVPIACVSETPTGSLSLSILHFIPLRLFTGSSDSTLAVTPDLRPESVFSLSPVLHLLTSYPFQVFCVDTHLPCTYAHLSLTGHPSLGPHWDHSEGREPWRSSSFSRVPLTPGG